MSKKYTPSGYQIINIDFDRLDEDSYLPKETEDEKILFQILKTGIVQKPILLHEKTTQTTGFPVISEHLLSIQSLLSDFASNVTIVVKWDSEEDKLLVTYEY